MAKDIWFISDHHLSHAKILTFKDKHDCLIRPEFDTVEQMNDYMLQMHNQTVKPNDDVYFLGDVLWNKPEAWKTFLKMEGNIKLTPGNHDDILALAASDHIHDFRLWYKFEAGGKKLLACHCPLNTYDIVRTQINVHGHIHEKTINDPRYFNVCVEQMGYEPIHIEDIIALVD